MQAHRWFVSVFVACAIVAAPGAGADQDDTQTGVSGSAAGDTIDAAAPVDVIAAVVTDSGETITATATGIDSLAGDDTVTTNAGISSIAAAAAAIATAPGETEASATSTAVNAGDGDDSVASHGDAVAVSTATAAYAGALAVDDDSAGDDVTIDVSVTAKGESTGIDAGDGDDSIVSTGPVDAVAVSVSGGSADQLQANISDSVTLKAASVSNATTTGIAAGAGTDSIEASGTVNSSATAVSGALAVGVTAGDAANPDKKTQLNLDASATAEATATGISSDAAGDERSSEVTVQLGVDGIRVTLFDSVTTNSADDTLVNDVQTTATATATSGAAAGGLAGDTKGTVAAKSNANATARSTALSTGGGNDSVTNDGALDSTATGVAGALSVVVAQKGGAESKAEANVVSDATATGIATDGQQTNSTTQATLEITSAGVAATFDLQETSDGGIDSVDNSGAIEATAVSTGAAGAGGISIDGAASADVNSVARAASAAITTGGAGDLVGNGGELTSTATSTAAALAVGFGQNGDADAAEKLEVAVNAKTQADANAAGIATDDGMAAHGVTSHLTITASGLDGGYSDTTASFAGADRVGNTAAVTSTATSTAAAVGVTVAIDGAASADVTSDATASTSAVTTGGGADSVTSSGELTATSTATAGAIAAAIGQKSSDTASAKTKVDAKTSATATATGIGSDVGTPDRTTSVDLSIDAAGLTLDAARTSQTGAGDDVVTNTGAVTTDATAGSGTLAAAVTIKGAARADAGSAATANSVAVDTGGGADRIDNDGVLDAGALATAVTLNATVSTEGNAAANSGFLGAGTSANSLAVGLSSAGAVADTSTTLHTFIDFADVGVTASYQSVTDGIGADGGDVIDNSGSITADSDAIAAQLSASVSGKGVALTLGRAEAGSHAGAIEAGNGDDTVTNTGNLDANALASAAMANVAVTAKGLAVAANAVWDGGTTSNASAVGIDADSGTRTTDSVTVEANADRAQVVYLHTVEAATGNDVVDNSGNVTTTATAISPSLSVAVAAKGVAASVSTATANADATGLRGGAGNDAIANDGQLTSIADATAATANVSVTNGGVAAAADAVWDGGTKANANATGIAGDGGNRLQTTRIAVGTDETGKDDTSQLASGADTITNTRLIDADATARALSVSFVVAVNGVGAASATATADARAAAIDAGAGDDADSVTNSGDLTADAASTAAAASVSVTNSGLAVAADAVWDGGTHASAAARGVDVGNGADTLTNTGDATASADALSLSAAIAVSINGAAGAVSTATATADSSALHTGAGDDVDTVTNSGALTANADASAASAAVSFTANGLAVSGGNVWDGGTRGEAKALTIALGGGADVLTNDGALTADSSADATGISVSVAVNGVAGAITAATADSTATAIDLAGGNDQVVSRGDITATAWADANTVSVAGTEFGVSVAGNNAWDGGTHGIAAATGISGGAGLDAITNSADIDSTATVIAPSVGVSLTVGGVAASVSTATAAADASAIDGGDDADNIDNTGELTVTADGNAVAVNVALTGVGAAVAADAVWDGGTTATGYADGIRGGAGNDHIDNTTANAAITANADADATSASVAITASGFSGAVSTSTSVAHAGAIDAGAGDDVVFNDSVLTSDADATATSVAISVTGAGGALASDAFWDGGTGANGFAAGMVGGDGNDTSTNAGTISADASSSTTSVSIAAVASQGLAAAVVASTSNADAFGMTGDGGDDTVVNSGGIHSTTLAEAEGVSVAFAATGGAIAGAHVDAATRANGTAEGIAGGAGSDTLRNDATGTIDLDATARARETAVALTLGGIAEADSTSIATARGIGIDGGDGNDVLGNAGSIVGAADAAAAARSITFALFGDGTATADATGDAFAAGISGGAGADQLSNTGTIDLTPTASAVGQAIAVTVGGVSISEANASGVVDAAGMAGGSGADALTNAGDVIAATTASTIARSVSASVGGYAVGKANSNAEAAVSGLRGDADDDVIVNAASGSVDVSATANATATSVTVTVAGAADGEARTRPIVHATGLAGDAGNDTVSNDGAVAVLGKSRSESTSSSVSVAGSSSAKAGTEVETYAVGIDGGAGVDHIVNRGSIRVGPGEGDDPWMSELVTTASSFGFSGDVSAQSAAYAQTGSTGIGGGSENDDISNQGELTVVATARSSASQGTLNIFGSADGGGRSGAFTRAAGIDGGDGDDALASTTTLAVTAQSHLLQDGTTFSFAGSGALDAALEAGTEAVGLDGGAGSDTLTTAGTIAVHSTSTLISQGGGDTVFGTSAAAGQSGASTRTVGIDGGDGADTIDSAAAMTLTATSTLTLDNATYTFGGTGQTGGTLAASTSVDGFAGGAGSDAIASSGAIIIDATSNLTSTGGTDTTFGGASSSVTSGGRALARGFAGGEGDDVIENRADGSIDLTATTRVGANAVAYTFLGGGSKNDAALTGAASSVGMAGEAGNDILVNRGDIRIVADAALASQGGAKTTITGTSDPVSTGVSEVAADAVGLSGADGDDQLTSTGLLQVRAIGVASAQNEASSNGVSIVNGNEAGAVTRAGVDAVGIAAGAGANDVVVGGDMAVTATSTGYALALSSGATVSLASDGASVANSRAEARATGVSADDGENDITLGGRTTVTADATTAKRVLIDVTVYRDIRSNDEGDVLAPPPSLDTAQLPAFTDSNGNPINRDTYPAGSVVFWTQSPPDQQDPNNPDGYSGGYYIVNVDTVDPDGPSGPQAPVEVWSWEFVADGLVQAQVVQQIQDAFPSYAAANGAGIAGEGTGRATGSAVAEARGVSLGDGAGVIRNDGELIVLATAEAAVNVSADGDGFGDALGVANSTAFARAIGFELGDGANTVTNTGELTVTATPVAQSLTDVTGGDVCIWFFGWWCGGGGDGTGYSNASITASAAGVVAGDGANVIVNDGTIDVVARPEIRSDARTGEFVVDVRQDNAESTTVTVASDAVGIRTGDGANTITNNGSISVAAWDLLSACATAGCRSLTLEKGIDTSTVTAAGIVTGAGNDIVRNNGSVSALVFNDGVATAAVGIATAAGNDQLFLGDGSSVTGSVDLGDGDDALTLTGTPVIIDANDAALVPQGGAGDDTLVLDGAGSFATTPASFEHARKIGAGTYLLPALNTMRTLTIEQDTLALDANYVFAADGTFATYIAADGGRGQLNVDGSVVLDGAIEVEKRGSTFVSDGSRYTLVATTQGVGGAFDDVSLPAPLPLLRFELQQSAATVDVLARAASFATVADEPLYRRIALDLDSIADGATGDFDTVLGTLQSMQSGFDEAFASLSSDAHFAGGQGARDAAMQWLRLLQQHFDSTRAIYRDRLPSSLAYGDVAVALRQNGIAAIGFASNPRVAFVDAEGPGAAPMTTAAGGGAPASVRQGDPRAQTWALGAVGQGDYDEVDGYAQFDSDSSVIAVGQDFRIDEDWMAGVSVGRTQTNIDLNDIHASTDVDGWYGSVYGTWFDARAYVEGALSYSTQSFDTKRTVTVGPIVRRATSDHDGDAWLGYLGTGYQFERGRAYAQPYAALYYFDASQDSFREKGADSLDQLIDDQNTRAWISDAGARTGLIQALESGVIDWHASVAWSHDFDAQDGEIRFAWAGEPQTFFTLDARDLSADSAVLGAGVAYIGRTTTLALDYRGLFNSDYRDDALGARWSLRF